MTSLLFAQATGRISRCSIVVIPTSRQLHRVKHCYYYNIAFRKLCKAYSCSSQDDGLIRRKSLCKHRSISSAQSR
jgi:hypothetical protein